MGRWAPENCLLGADCSSNFVFVVRFCVSVRSWFVRNVSKVWNQLGIPIVPGTQFGFRLAWLDVNLVPYWPFSCRGGFRTPYVGFGRGSFGSVRDISRVQGHLRAPQAFPGLILIFEWRGWMHIWCRFCRSRAEVVFGYHTCALVVDVFSLCVAFP